jgi:hypothetical protein
MNVADAVLERSVTDTGNSIAPEMVNQAGLLFGRLRRHTNNSTVGAALRSLAGASKRMRANSASTRTPPAASQRS